MIAVRGHKLSIPMVLALIIILNSRFLFLVETSNATPPTILEWLLHPNGGEAVGGVVTIRWDTSKTSRLDSKDKIWLGWSHDVRGGAGKEGDWPYPSEVFQHENWEGCYCQTWEVITDSAPNNGSYEWNATKALEQCNGETYPYYIKIISDIYVDASNTFFNITSSLSQSTCLTVPLADSAEADGYIKTEEYCDALEVDLSNGTWEAYLYLKHDIENLYVFVDHVSDVYRHPAGYDNGWLAIDVLGDGGNAPQNDDYLFHSSSMHAYIGDGARWKEIREPPVPLKFERDNGYRGFGVSVSGGFGFSPNSLAPHSIFEFKIPITGWEIEGKESFGLCVASGSPGTNGDLRGKVVWPVRSHRNFTADFYPGGVKTLDPYAMEPPTGSFPPPSTWGTVTLEKPVAGGGGTNFLFWLVIGATCAVILAAGYLILTKWKLGAPSSRYPNRVSR